MELTLFWAANGGDVEEVKEILRNNPNVDVNWKDNATGMTALIRASMNGHDSVISVLLAHSDIDVNVSDSEGETPLMTACGSERESCFRLLLEDSRVKVNQPNNEGWTPLRLLATGGQMSTIKWWIASGREMDLGKPGEENTDAIQQARWTEWWWSETAKEGKAKLATLLEKFKESPEETRYLVKLELGLLDELAAEIFALVVFVSGLSPRRPLHEHPRFQILRHCHSVTPRAPKDAVLPPVWLRQGDHLGKSQRAGLQTPRHVTLPLKRHRFAPNDESSLCILCLVSHFNLKFVFFFCYFFFFFFLCGWLWFVSFFPTTNFAHLSCFLFLLLLLLLLLFSFKCTLEERTQKKVSLLFHQEKEKEERKKKKEEGNPLED